MTLSGVHDLFMRYSIECCVWVCGSNAYSSRSSSLSFGLFQLKKRQCLKKQVVDLVAEGYHPEGLDAQPSVTVEDW